MRARGTGSRPHSPLPPPQTGWPRSRPCSRRAPMWEPRRARSMWPNGREPTGRPSVGSTSFWMASANGRAGAPTGSRLRARYRPRSMPRERSSGGGPMCPIPRTMGRVATARARPGRKRSRRGRSRSRVGWRSPIPGRPGRTIQLLHPRVPPRTVSLWVHGAVWRRCTMRFARVMEPQRLHFWRGAPQSTSAPAMAPPPF